MSNFPNNFDDDTTLPFVNDNITEVGGDAINALRDAVFSIQQYLGLGGAGTTPSISSRLGISLFPDGTIKPSAITSLGLVTLPITNNQIANNADIPESKLHLDHRTQDLFNYIRDLSGDVNIALGWISTTGIKLEPHLIGAIYRHDMKQIDVSSAASDFLFNNRRLLRNNLNSYTLVADMNAELLAHQWADGSPFGSPYTVTTNNGSVYSSDYGHTGSAIFINTSRFNNIPQTADDVQLFAEYIDSASIFLLGTRIQNLYTNGISRVSRSSSLTTDGYGQSIVPPTPAVAFLKNIGNISNPFDDIDTGDDIIEFKPSLAQQLNNTFDAKFALVKVGDIVRINYGTIEVPFVIKEKKYSGTPGSKKYIIRIAGKNQFYSSAAIARIDKPLFNGNKYGELAISPANNQFGGIPSLIINNPRGAQTLGLGFNPDQFDENHYLLYLALYPTGHASDGYTILPGIDVTGNQGTTPGGYTLESIVQATNNAFRSVGFNYRFAAFSYQGEFGICLADSYNNAAFSIVTVALKANGTVDSLATTVSLPKNVVDIQPTVGNVAPDPLGFGPVGSGSASPVYYATYGSPVASQFPTKLFVPLRRNSYYVDGTEKERLDREPTQALDGYGDGYWVGTIQDVQVPAGRVQTTYRIPLDLSTSGLKTGKTIVVQSLGAGTLIDFGRYTIQSVVFGCSPAQFTDITVYDSVHAIGFSPSAVSEPFAQVKIYFGPDSVSFNTESATDYSVYTPFKRHFEVYVDPDGRTFTHERGRINISGNLDTINNVPLYGFTQLNKFDIVKISPKLRGFQYGSVNKITLRVFSYSSTTGVYDGYLSAYDGTFFTHFGPRITGRKGEVTRFYDETNTDYIDVIFDANAAISEFADQLIDFQLFPSLALDDQLMLLGTCQVNDTTKVVNKIVDGRQFGNTSEKDLSSSVFDYMSAPERHLHSNGVIRGFDVYQQFNGSSAIMSLTGGIVLVNGKLININNDTVTIPAVKENFGTALWNVNWAVCINELGEYKIIPLLDVTTLPTPGTTDRTFSATDVLSSTSYTIPALKFVDLVNGRKDLVVLYVVTATVTGTITPNVAITTKDARKFVYKKDWGERPTLAGGIEIGEFRNFESLNSWFTLNATYSNVVNIKGTFSNLPATVGLTSRTRYFGDGSVVWVPTASTQTFSNIDLASAVLAPSSNINLVVASSTFTGVTQTGVFNMTATSSTFKDGTITNVSGGTVTFSGCTLENMTFNFANALNVIFNGCSVKNCIFNFNSAVNFQANNIFVTNLSFFENNTFILASAANSIALAGDVLGNRFLYSGANQSIVLNGIVTVTNNQFLLSTTVTTTQMLSVLDGTSGVIDGNLFTRGANVLSAYIAAPVSWTSGQVSITNNFFDNTTFDGTSQKLVSNLPLAWIYANNLNTPPTLNVRKLTTGPYTVVASDHVFILEQSSAITINLPSVVNSPPGRTLIIKDVLGRADFYSITLHRFVNTETIENLASDFTIKNPYSSIVLVLNTNGWIML